MGGCINFPLRACSPLYVQRRSSYFNDESDRHFLCDSDTASARFLCASPQEIFIDTHHDYHYSFSKATIITD